MKIKIKLSIIFLLIFCSFTISSADVGIGISEVGTISSITGIEGENTTPVGFFLNQNYPNPFNPSTTIEFTLPKSEYVELKIYNILGKEVSTLVSMKLNPGNHTYTFDGKNLATGIYYYQLVAGDYREVKKMILLR
jgi:flagellar hook assembly protein FlgD